MLVPLFGDLLAAAEVDHECGGFGRVENLRWTFAAVIFRLFFILRAKCVHRKTFVHTAAVGVGRFVVDLRRHVDLLILAGAVVVIVVVVIVDETLKRSLDRLALDQITL